MKVLTVPALQRFISILPPISLAVCVALCAAGCGDTGDKDDRQAQVSATAPAQPVPAAVADPDAIEKGRDLLKQGQYESAVDHFTRALDQARRHDLVAETNAREAQVYFDRGLAYLKMGFPDTAIEDFTAAIDLLPQHADAYQERARAFVQLGDVYKSLRDCTQAIRLKPRSAEAYRLRGDVYMRRAQYDRAVADLQQAMKENPTLSEETGPQLGEAYFKWSQELSEAGDAAGAAEKLAKARDLNPALVEQATVATAEVQPATMEQTVAKPILDDAQKKFQEGLQHQQAERYDQAIIEYTRALALRPDFDDAYLRRGETLLLLGFPDTALEDLKRASHRGGRPAEANRLQAKAYMQLENFNRAAMSATDALHADPSDAPTYALRGDAYLKIENWTRAIADLEEAVRRDPSLGPKLQASLDAAQRGQTAARRRDAQPESVSVGSEASGRILGQTSE
jgi:tetratricopeptide (TPR) repeat protein